LDGPAANTGGIAGRRAGNQARFAVMKVPLPAPL
jgi:hypothetical protein